MPIMRKELRIGFAVGGVLLAVIIVYVLTVGGSRKPDANGDKADATVKPIVPSADSIKSDKPSEQASATPAAPPAAEKPAPAPSADATARADKKSGDLDWGKLLSGE